MNHRGTEDTEEDKDGGKEEKGGLAHTLFPSPDLSLCSLCLCG